MISPRNIVTLFIFFLGSWTIGATSIQSINKLLEEKKYAEAVILLEKKVFSGEQNETIFYNLGNSYFELKQYGKAIWAYEGALKFSPLNEDVISKLNDCSQELHKKEPWFPAHSWLNRIKLELGSNFWAFASLFGSLGLGIILFLLIKTVDKSWKRIGILFAGLLFLFSALSVYFATSTRNQITQNHFAIVVEKKSDLFRNQNNVETADIVLTEGDRIDIVKEYPEYILIELPNKKRYFIEKKQVRLI